MCIRVYVYVYFYMSVLHIHVYICVYAYMQIHERVNKQKYVAHDTFGWNNIY